MPTFANIKAIYRKSKVLASTLLKPCYVAPMRFYMLVNSMIFHDTPLNHSKSVYMVHFRGFSRFARASFLLGTKKTNDTLSKPYPF